MTSSALTRFTILAIGLLLQAGVSRLAASGAAGDVDPSFDAGSGLDGGVSAVAVQPDGNVLVAHTHGLAGFDSDGLRGFEATTTNDDGFSRPVAAIAVQPDGRILIGGDFGIVGGVVRNGIARLLADGRVDAGFEAGGEIDNSVCSIALQPDGKVLVGGEITTLAGARTQVSRLHADGREDGTFRPGSGADDLVRALALQPDGRVLVGGEFTLVSGLVRPRLARLFGDPPPSLDIAVGDGSVVLSWPVTPQAVQHWRKAQISRDRERGRPCPGNRWWPEEG